MRHVFVDESSQNAHQHMVLGALVIPGQFVASAESLLLRVLTEHNMFGELKWSKVSRSKLHVYRAFLSAYFDEIVSSGGEFHALVLECKDLNHRRFNDGDPDLGYNKFMYQLLYHRVGRPYGRYERIVADLDARNSTRNPYELGTILNAKASQELDTQPFARVAHRNSKDTRLLQLADLLSGAIAWHKNDHDSQSGASESKCDLAAYVASKVGRFRLGADTARAERRLGVWNFQLRK